jgi:hypothetical protein
MLPLQPKGPPLPHRCVRRPRGEGGTMTRHPRAGCPRRSLRPLKRQSPFRPNMETGWPLGTEPLRAEGPAGGGSDGRGVGRACGQSCRGGAAVDRCGGMGTSSAVADVVGARARSIAGVTDHRRAQWWPVLLQLLSRHVRRVARRIVTAGIPPGMDGRATVGWQTLGSPAPVWVAPSRGGVLVRLRSANPTIARHRSAGSHCLGLAGSWVGDLEGRIDQAIAPLSPVITGSGRGRRLPNL